MLIEKNGKCESNRECKRGTLCSAWPSFARRNVKTPQNRQMNPSSLGGSCQTAESLNSKVDYRFWMEHISDKWYRGGGSLDGITKLSCKYGAAGTIGKLQYGSVKQGTISIMWVGTDKDWQGKGVGKALLTRALNKIKEEKSDTTGQVVLTVKDCDEPQGNPPAERLYKRCGFKWRDSKDYKRTCEMYLTLKKYKNCEKSIDS
uniref:N-acetyltransferase domain-containing protein n=1 Tax=Ditylenchus dipsaci TaxID=166011 RepID=A0A915CP32_9BILA